jgi:hypothetical protein
MAKGIAEILMNRDFSDFQYLVQQKIGSYFSSGSASLKNP